MYARVKSDCAQRMIIACGGNEYIKGPWRPVPSHEEASAKANPYLETRPDYPQGEEQETAQAIVPLPAEISNESRTVRMINRKDRGDHALQDETPRTAAPEKKSERKGK